MDLAIHADDVRAAAERIRPLARRTPVLTSPDFDRAVGKRIFFKCENLQRGGAFKIRGASNLVLSLPPAALEKGVVAYSSGNHAQAVALAARLLGAHATILMPTDAPLSKLDATRGYGAEVVPYDRYAEDRAALGAALAAERGLELVRPYDDSLIMSGAGTAALELLEDAGVVDTLVVPLGGGGLIAGSATIAKELGVRRVIGIEPEAGDDWRRSFLAGEPVTIDVPRTIADGLQTNAPGKLTWEVASRLVDEIVTVTDTQIVAAMRFAFERLKLVVEPSGAVGIAAVLNGIVEAPSIGILISGGNVGADRFAELLTA